MFDFVSLTVHEMDIARGVPYAVERWEKIAGFKRG